MRIWYEVNDWMFGDKVITKVEVERSTDVSIWVNGNRRSIQSKDCNFFRDFEEAKNFAIGRLTRRSDVAQARADRLKSKLELVKNLDVRDVE